MCPSDDHTDSNSELLYRLFQELESAVLAVDSQRQVLFINRHAQDLLGFPEDEALGRPLDHLHSSEKAPVTRAVVSALDTALVSGKGFQRQLLTAETDRGVRTFGCSTTPLFSDGGQLEMAIMLFTDVTEIHADDRRRTALECESHTARVTSWIGHELRNPLATIRLYSQLLARRAEPELQDTIQVITEQVDLAQSRLSEVIRTVSGPSSDSWAPAVSRFDELLKDYLDREMSALGHLSIDADIGPGEYYVPVGEEEATSLISNILSNAVEAVSGPGKIGVSLSEKANTVRFQVEDTGAGFPDEEPQRLMEPFVTAKKRGVGLGLSTVRRICDSARGQILLENTAQGGARVTVELPNLHPGLIEGRRILLVEDEENLRNLLARSMEQHGATVEHAEDGKGAMESMARQAPEALVTDLRMPGIGGLDLIETAGKHTPVLVISGAAHVDADSLDPRREGLAFLAKPFELHEFMLALTYVIWEVGA